MDKQIGEGTQRDKRSGGVTQSETNGQRSVGVTRSKTKGKKKWWSDARHRETKGQTKWWSDTKQNEGTKEVV